MRYAVAACLLLLSAPRTLAQQLADEAPPPELAAKVATASAAVDAGGSGPWHAVMSTDTSLPTHTLYHPKDISKALRTGKLPIVAWGNGACTNIGNRFRYFLTELASNGYLVIAVGPPGPRVVEWKIDINAPGAPPPTQRLPPSYAAQLTDAIDWAIAENTRKGSPFFNKLNTKAIAVMGQSCGGLQAISAAADTRVSTLIVWNSGTFPDDRPPLAGTGDAARASLKRIRVPAAWISGDESDIAWVNANADFDLIQSRPVMRAWLKGAGHSEVFREPRGGSFGPVGVAWLNWQLKGDRRSASYFTGADCVLCRDPHWVVKWKN
jgi:dienelactone hydrolase